MKIALYGRKIERSHLDNYDKLYSKLIQMGIEVLIHHELVEETNKFDQLTLPHWESYKGYKDLDESVDFLISIGGDGTFLNTILMIRDLNIPVIGINTGRLGFLSNTPISEIEQALERLESKEYTIEERNMLSLSSSGDLFGEDNIALNEVSILKRDSASMITIHVELNGDHLNSYWTDGIIISTSTGSTAYSLSCGGPILMPGSGNFVITPIAPHNLNVRPIVIDDNSKLTLRVESRSDKSLVALDSRSVELMNDEILTLQKADFTLSVVHFKDNNFIQSLRHKLNWGLDKRNS